MDAAGARTRWVQYYTEEGAPYYFDSTTGRSIWASPSDWLMHHDPSGRAFFQNTITGESVWAEEHAAAAPEPAAAPQTWEESFRIPRSSSLDTSIDSVGGGDGGAPESPAGPWAASNAKRDRRRRAEQTIRQTRKAAAVGATTSAASAVGAAASAFASGSFVSPAHAAFASPAALSRSVSEPMHGGVSSSGGDFGAGSSRARHAASSVGAGPAGYASSGPHFDAAVPAPQQQWHPPPAPHGGFHGHDDADYVDGELRHTLPRPRSWDGTGAGGGGDHVHHRSSSAGVYHHHHHHDHDDYHGGGGAVDDHLHHHHHRSASVHGASGRHYHSPYGGPAAAPAARASSMHRYDDEDDYGADHSHRYHADDLRYSGGRSGSGGGHVPAQYGASSSLVRGHAPQHAGSGGSSYDRDPRRGGGSTRGRDDSYDASERHPARSSGRSGRGAGADRDAEAGRGGGRRGRFRRDDDDYDEDASGSPHDDDDDHDLDAAGASGEDDTLSFWDFLLSSCGRGAGLPKSSTREASSSHGSSPATSPPGEVPGRWQQVLARGPGGAGATALRATAPRASAHSLDYDLHRDVEGASTSPPASLAAAATPAGGDGGAAGAAAGGDSFTVEDAAKVFVGLSLDERVKWVQKAVIGAGAGALNSARALSLYLTSQSISYVASFFKAAATGSVDSMKLVRMVAAVAVRTLSPHSELPMRSSGSFRASISGAGGTATAPPLGAAAARAASKAMHGGAGGGAESEDDTAYHSAVSPGTPQAARYFGGATGATVGAAVAGPSCGYAPGSLVDRLFSAGAVQSMMPSTGGAMPPLPVSTVLTWQTYDGVPTDGPPADDSGASAYAGFAEDPTLVVPGPMDHHQGSYADHAGISADAAAAFAHVMASAQQHQPFRGGAHLAAGSQGGLPWAGASHESSFHSAAGDVFASSAAAAGEDDDADGSFVTCKTEAPAGLSTSALEAPQHATGSFADESFATAGWTGGAAGADASFLSAHSQRSPHRPSGAVAHNEFSVDGHPTAGDAVRLMPYFGGAAATIMMPGAAFGSQQRDLRSSFSGSAPVLADLAVESGLPVGTISASGAPAYNAGFGSRLPVGASGVSADLSFDDVEAGHGLSSCGSPAMATPPEAPIGGSAPAVAAVSSAPAKGGFGSLFSSAAALLYSPSRQRAPNAGAPAGEPSAPVVGVADDLSRLALSPRAKAMAESAAAQHHRTSAIGVASSPDVTSTGSTSSGSREVVARSDGAADDGFFVSSAPPRRRVPGGLSVTGAGTVPPPPGIATAPPPAAQHAIALTSPHGDTVQVTRIETAFGSGASAVSAATPGSGEGSLLQGDWRSAATPASRGDESDATFHSPAESAAASDHTPARTPGDATAAVGSALPPSAAASRSALFGSAGADDARTLGASVRGAAAAVSAEPTSGVSSASGTASLGTPGGPPATSRSGGRRAAGASPSSVSSATSAWAAILSGQSSPLPSTPPPTAPSPLAAGPNTSGGAHGTSTGKKMRRMPPSPSQAGEMASFSAAAAAASHPKHHPRTRGVHGDALPGSARGASDSRDGFIDPDAAPSIVTAAAAVLAGEHAPPAAASSTPPRQIVATAYSLRSARARTPPPMDGAPVETHGPGGAVTSAHASV